MIYHKPSLYLLAETTPLSDLTKYETIELFLKWGVPAIGLFLVLIIVIVALWKGNTSESRRKFLITFSICVTGAMIVARLLLIIPTPPPPPPPPPTSPITIELVMEPSPEGNTLIKELVMLKVRHNRVSEPFTNGIVKLSVNPGDGVTVNVEKLISHLQGFKNLGVVPSQP